LNEHFKTFYEAFQVKSYIKSKLTKCKIIHPQYTAISIKVVQEQSGKVEHERERLLGIANKLMNLSSKLNYLLSINIEYEIN
jgi:hypothetical protein